jgi:YkoY family integral membrane protein
MGIIDSIIQNFNHYSFSELFSTLSNPVNFGIIFSLIIMEGLLSSDNALVLAIMVKHLPVKQRKKALFYGILGAYAFRFIAIGFGTLLISLWWIKLLGAGYLLWMALKYFKDKLKGQAGEEEVKENNFGFWRTVIAVELMDIAFSADSILAALGISDKLWVLWIGAILGILMMRGVAQIFVALIEKFPELETTAYLLIGFIGIKMLLTIPQISVHMPEYVFITVMVTLFLGTFLVHHFKEKKQHVVAYHGNTKRK